MSVQQKIDLAIRATGSISIQDFVEISNFSKKDGFYNSEEIQKIGNRGHFITSPEISSLFGICLTNQFLSVFSNLKAVKSDQVYRFNYYGLINAGSLESINSACLKLRKIF